MPWPNNRARHSNRQVHRGRFGVGDVVHIPGAGPVHIEMMSKRYFTGRTAAGEPYGKTSIGLAEGQTMRGEPAPWRVERRGSVE